MDSESDSDSNSRINNNSQYILPSSCFAEGVENLSLGLRVWQFRHYLATVNM